MICSLIKVNKNFAQNIEKKKKRGLCYSSKNCQIWEWATLAHELGINSCKLSKHIIFFEKYHSSYNKHTKNKYINKDIICQKSNPY